MHSHRGTITSLEVCYDYPCLQKRKLRQAWETPSLYRAWKKPCLGPWWIEICLLEAPFGQRAEESPGQGNAGAVAHSTIGSNAGVAFIYDPFCFPSCGPSIWARSSHLEFVV
jgi:hypothetical protein